VGNKRPSTITTTRAKKRVKSDYAQLPLTNIILATPGNKEGDMPELVFSRFYDCRREAVLGRESYDIRINIKREGGESEHRDEQPKPDERITIPVPLENIEGISILSGMNPCEDLLKAYTDRFALQASIEAWTKVIAQRTEVHEKKRKAFLELPEIPDEPPAEPETETPAVEAEKENEQMATQESEPQATDENAPEGQEGVEADTDESKVAEEQPVVTEEERQRAEEEAQWKLAEKKKEEKERKARARLQFLKKREQDIKKRSQIEAAVDKLGASVERAKESLANEQQKLEDLITEFGQWFAYFQDEVDGDVALKCFQDVLVEGMEPNPEPAVVQEPVAEPEVAESNVEQAEMEIDESNDEGEAKVAQPMEEDNAQQPENAEESTEAAEVEMEQQEETAEDDGEITKTPVWISILLKKPLDKFYASALKNSICEKEVLEKASLILLKYNPKHKTKIVLKNVTYRGSEEDLKHLNQVVKGPWKSIRKNASKLVKDKSAYTLDKIVHYLAKIHQRQQVVDNIVDTCTLCERTIKRMFMDKHMTKFCLKRHEPCEYCEEAFVFEEMDEHHQGDCPKFPIECPLKCPVKIARDSVEEHHKTCMNASVLCEFYSLGCKAELKRRDLTLHMQKGAIEHVKLLNAQLMFVSGYLADRDSALAETMNPTPPAKEESGENEKDKEKMDVN